MFFIDRYTWASGPLAGDYISGAYRCDLSEIVVFVC